MNCAAGRCKTWFYLFLPDLIQYIFILFKNRKKPELNDYKTLTLLIETEGSNIFFISVFKLHVLPLCQRFSLGIVINEQAKNIQTFPYARKVLVLGKIESCAKSPQLLLNEAISQSLINILK